MPILWPARPRGVRLVLATAPPRPRYGRKSGRRH
ncbi:hypothetical protein VG1_CDS0033 [Arthrobacter phage Cupello]|nr:hypothetical protein VG1_CDS0033 [Arthrobacter phage Cupello]